MEKARHLLSQTQNESEIDGEHLELMRKDGTHFWVNLTTHLHRDENGRPIERRVILEDITVRKRIEEKLLLSKFMLDYAGDAFLWAGPDKRILYANEEAYRSLGFEPGELIGKHITDISPTHNPQTFLERIQALSNNSPIQYESVHRRKDGKEFPIEITLSALEHDKKTFTCAIVRDITKRKRREALLNGQKTVLEMIATGKPLQKLLDYICQMIEKQTDGMLCSILLLEGKTLRTGGAPNLPISYSEKIDGLVIGPRGGSCGTAAYRREPVIVENIKTDPLWERIRGIRLTSWLTGLLVDTYFFYAGKGVGDFCHVLPPTANSQF